MESFMKKELKVGQRVRARAVELREENRLIVSIDGNLFGVINSSFEPIKQNQHIDLVVTHVKPLQFSLLKLNQQRLNRII
jgi:hypothetical protein